jgi:hypothetical protein
LEAQSNASHAAGGGAPADFEDLLLLPTADRAIATWANERTLADLSRLGRSFPAIDAALMTRYWRFLEMGRKLRPGLDSVVETGEICPWPKALRTGFFKTPTRPIWG